MNREELLALCEKAPKIGEVDHKDFIDYFIVLEQNKKVGRDQWQKVYTPYMTVAGRIAMATEDHRRQGKQLHFEDPVVLDHDEKVITLMVTVVSEVYGRRHGIASSNKVSGGPAEKGSPWEVAETSAIGRALGAFGYGVIPGSGLASADDMERLSGAESAPAPHQQARPRAAQRDRATEYRQRRASRQPAANTVEGARNWTWFWSQVREAGYDQTEARKILAGAGYESIRLEDADAMLQALGIVPQGVEA